MRKIIIILIVLLAIGIFTPHNASADSWVKQEKWINEIEGDSWEPIESWINYVDGLTWSLVESWVNFKSGFSFQKVESWVNDVNLLFFQKIESWTNFVDLMFWEPIESWINTIKVVFWEPVMNWINFVENRVMGISSNRIANLILWFLILFFPPLAFGKMSGVEGVLGGLGVGAVVGYIYFNLPLGLFLLLLSAVVIGFVGRGS